MKLFKKGQGATEYLLMLAAVLVIVAIAVYYVTSTGGYPAVTAAAVYENSTGNIVIQVSSGSIPANEWEYAISATKGATPTWVTGTAALKAASVTLENRVDSAGTATDDATTYYISLRHKASTHVYFTDEAV